MPLRVADSCPGMEVQIYSLAIEDIAEEFKNAANQKKGKYECSHATKKRYNLS